MTVNLNTSPYYDDYSSTSNYYRILFKPGRSVQARELTQLQSTLQNQIEQFGKNIFKEGSLVTGGQSTIGSGVYLKINTLSTSLTSYVNNTIVGATSGATGTVIYASDPVTGFQTILHVYVKGGLFIPGESFTITETGATGVLDSSDEFQGKTLFYSIQEGVFFSQGFFVYCEPQTVVVSPTLSVSPSARIGLKVTRSIETSDEDVTLLDPAVESSNYFAPGADRLSINLELISLEYDSGIEGSDSIELEDYIEIANIRDGQIISRTDRSQYNIIGDEIARRTYDESGDYTVKPFLAKVRNHIYGDNTKLSLEVTAGKAYVKGYAFETTSPSYITIDRARDFTSEANFPVSIDYSRYVKVSNITGHFNIFTGNVVTLHNTSISSVDFNNNTNFWSTVIGTARPRNLLWDTGNVYKLFLYDVDLSSGQVFSNTLSFVEINGSTINSPTGVIAKANIYGSSTITSTLDDSLLFKLPYNTIKSISDQSYTSKVQFLNQSFTTNGTYANASIAISSIGGTFIGDTGTYLSAADAKARFIVIKSDGTVIDLSATNHKVRVDSPTQVTISIPSISTFSATVILAAQFGSAPKTKLLQTANVVIPGTSDITNINLNYPDVHEIVNVSEWYGNNYTGLYTVDSGQRDDYYDYGRAVIKSGTTPPSLDPSSNLTITFNYFSHSGSSGYFSSASYVNSGVEYGDIPVYRTLRGDIYSLADVIDFRPVRSTSISTSIITNQIPEASSLFITDFEYYLPRKDRFTINKEGRFAVIKGISDVVPQLPAEDPDGMTLYTVDLPAYSARISDVQLGFIDHKRFTMRDIGRIQKRVDRLEYYSALNLLEKIASDERVPSDIPGIDRFKSGIVVDPFTGYSVSDITSVDYRCSIDKVYNTLRPPISYRSIYFDIDTGTSSTFKKFGDIITLDYSETSHIRQTEATTAISVRPFDVFTWTGRMTLDPATDVWGDTYNNGTVNINVNGENDAFSVLTPEVQGMSAWSTSTGYKTVFTGVTDVSVSTTARTVTDVVTVNRSGAVTTLASSTTSTDTATSLTTASGKAQVGLDFTSSGRTIVTNIGSKVIDTTLLPYMRSRPIKFFAEGLRPDTGLFATFDGVDVTDYIVPAMEIVFTTNAVPMNIEFSTVTNPATGWSGQVIAKKRNRLYVVPDTRYAPVAAGNTINFGTTGSTGTISSVSLPRDMITSSTGEVAGTFVLPNDESIRFNMGERKFRLADSLNDSFVTTVCETAYLAYGIASTKENTTLSTRYNLVNVTPTLDTSTSASTVNTETTRTTGSTTTGRSTTLNLIEQPLQTVFCSQNPRGSGQAGIYTFRLNLGNGTGPGNIVCRAAAIPDSFKLSYGGYESSSGFMTTLAQSSSSIPTYNNNLQILNLPGVSRFNISEFKLPFYKQVLGSDGPYATATVTVTAPFEGTGWSFSVDCPQYLPPAAPGSASMNFNLTNPFPTTLSQGDDWENRDRLRTSGATDLAYSVTLTNTARPGYSFIAVDKSIKVYGLSVSADATQSTGTTLSIISAGTFSRRVVNTGHTFLGYGGTTSTLISNRNFSGFPVTLAPGQSMNFIVRLQKSTQGIFNGDVVVSADVRGPDGATTVQCNTLRRRITTSRGTARPPAPPPPPVTWWVNDGDGGGGDPLSQTFFIDRTNDPAGVFISSVDLWFYEKDLVEPVRVELRPTVNGFPSATELLPFGSKTLESFSINASTTFQASNYTRFTFDTPVYTAPGEYAIVVYSNSKEYKVYTAKVGSLSLATGNMVAEQPATGVLFKSSNATAWVPESSEDLTFRINRCVFNTSQSLINLNARSTGTDEVFDSMYPSGDLLTFSDTTLNLLYKTTSNTSSSLSAFNNTTLDTDIFFTERKKLLASDGTSLPVRVEMQTYDDRVSPVLDLNRFHTVLITNIVNNDSTGEDEYLGGNALSKYVTKTVTLNSGFEAIDLKVYLNAYCPGNSSFKIYYKVGAPGTSDFERENKFIEFDSIVSDGNERGQYAEFTIGNTLSKCLPDGASFNSFRIKIVMLSDNPVYTPVIRDLRVIAVED